MNVCLALGHVRAMIGQWDSLACLHIGYLVYHVFIVAQDRRDLRDGVSLVTHWGLLMLVYFEFVYFISYS